MAVLRIERASRLPTGVAFERITAWERHGAHIPLTTVSVIDDRPEGVGTRIVARTGLGPIAFDDPMTVTQWQIAWDGRPGRCRLEKTGSVVLGWVEIEVHPDGDGSRVVWVEDIRVRGLPRLFDGPTRLGGEWMFGRSITGLLAGAPAM